MTRFEYIDPDGDKLIVYPGQRMDDRSAVSLYAEQGYESTNIHIPVDQLEEVIAGLRDMARQAGGQAAPARRRLTELEHDRAWHAIEGLDWDNADPDTVLNAVLAALRIDPPGLAACTPEWLASQPAGACDTAPRVDGRGDVSHYHRAAAGEAGA